MARATSLTTRTSPPTLARLTRLVRYRTAAELEVQQRANEYTVLPSLGDEMMEDVLREMPPYAQDRKSALEQRLIDQQHQVCVCVGGGVVAFL